MEPPHEHDDRWEETRWVHSLFTRWRWLIYLLLLLAVVALVGVARGLGSQASRAAIESPTARH